MSDPYRPGGLNVKIAPETTLGQLASHLSASGFIPCNSTGQCNPCRTFSTPKGVKYFDLRSGDFGCTVKDAGVTNGAVFTWGYF